LPECRLAKRRGIVNAFVQKKKKKKKKKKERKKKKKTQIERRVF
jgi:hypothetical protein